MLLFDSAAPVSTPRGGSRRPVFYSVFAHGDDSADSAGAPGDAMVMSHPRPAGTQKHVFLDGDSVRGRGGGLAPVLWHRPGARAARSPPDSKQGAPSSDGPILSSEGCGRPTPIPGIRGVKAQCVCARQQAKSAELGCANPFVRGVWPTVTDPCNRRCEGTVRVCLTASGERRAQMRQSFRPRGVAPRHQSLYSVVRRHSACVHGSK